MNQPRFHSLVLLNVMTSESLGNRLGTADRHLISVIGDQVNTIWIEIFKQKINFFYHLKYFYS